ncbi:CPBP family intramembrane glutamic endopeptidase [Propioniciclava soli]|uniref:CPBP family intramembrane glutamic endopeptidase n=1 Tax=Propioniciclava soli TaxID=2775081 RepID=UPI001E598DDE|nr:CPBP family intramembrane glutamic endopeptidase [Propioniciclava soli]
MSGATGLQRWPREPVPPSVDYPHVLRTGTAGLAQGVLGVALGLLSFVVAAPLVMQLLAAAYWLALGRPDTFEATYRLLVAYEVPFGLVVSHLGLAVLLPIAVLLVVLIHRGHPRFLSSVVGRLRPGWFALCFGIAVVTLLAVLVAQNLTAPGGPSWELAPQPRWWLFLLVMLLTTPLQAAAEEYFFRGYLMQALGSLVAAPWFGIVTSAAVFTMFHSSTNAALVLDRFAFGLLAGWLVWRTGGLEAAIAAHVVNNVTSFTLGALTSSMAQVRAVTEVTWVGAGWDVARFGLFTLVVWLVARRVRPARLTAAAPARAARRQGKGRGEGQSKGQGQGSGGGKGPAGGRPV